MSFFSCHISRFLTPPVSCMRSCDRDNECKIKLPKNEVSETVVSGLKRLLCKFGNAFRSRFCSQSVDKNALLQDSISTFCTLFPIFHASGSLPEPFLSPAIRLLAACFQAAAVGLGKWAQSACCQAIAPRKPPAHRQTAYYSRPRNLSPRQPEQCYGAAVTLLQLSRNNAPRLPEKPYSPLSNILYGSPSFSFQPITVQKRKSKGCEILASFCT